MLISYPPELVIGKREFEVANGNKVVDLEIGRRSLIIWMDPMQPQGSLQIKREIRSGVLNLAPEQVQLMSSKAGGSSVTTRNDPIAHKHFLKEHKCQVQLFLPKS